MVNIVAALNLVFLAIELPSFFNFLGRQHLRSGVNCYGLCEFMMLFGLRSVMWMYSAESKHIFVFVGRKIETCPYWIFYCRIYRKFGVTICLKPWIIVANDPTLNWMPLCSVWLKNLLDSWLHIEEHFFFFFCCFVGYLQMCVHVVRYNFNWKLCFED